jgi:hypothetical protein
MGGGARRAGARHAPGGSSGRPAPSCRRGPAAARRRDRTMTHCANKRARPRAGWGAQGPRCLGRTVPSRGGRRGSARIRGLGAQLKPFVGVRGAGLRSSPRRGRGRGPRRCRAPALASASPRHRAQTGPTPRARAKRRSKARRVRARRGRAARARPPRPRPGSGLPGLGAASRRLPPAAASRVAAHPAPPPLRPRVARAPALHAARPAPRRGPAPRPTPTLKARVQPAPAVGVASPPSRPPAGRAQAAAEAAKQRPCTRGHHRGRHAPPAPHPPGASQRSARSAPHRPPARRRRPIPAPAQRQAALSNHSAWPQTPPHSAPCPKHLHPRQSRAPGPSGARGAPCGPSWR